MGLPGKGEGRGFAREFGVHNAKFQAVGGVVSRGIVNLSNGYRASCHGGACRLDKVRDPFM